MKKQTLTPSPRSAIYLASLVMMFYGASALAEGTMPTVMETLKSTATSTNESMTTMALRTLGAALLLQWIISNWKDVFSGEMSSQFQKVAGLITWGGICFWAMGHQDILSTMFDGYLSVAKSITGIAFTPESIWANGVDMQNNMVISFNERTGSGDSLYSALKNLLPALMLMMCCLLILVSYGVIALSVFVAISEFWLMFTITPVAIALLGLQAFRDQGMAPLKGVISLGMRLMVLGVIVKVLGAVQTEVINSFDNMPEVQPMSTIWYAVGGVFACAVMAFNAGKIAAAISSGSSNFSGSDAMRGGLQMVSTAAAVGTMGATGASAMMSAGEKSLGGQGNASALAAAGTSMMGGGGPGGNLGVSSAMPGAPTVGGAIPPNPSGTSSSSFDNASSGDASSAGIGGSNPASPSQSSSGSSGGSSLKNSASNLLDKAQRNSGGDNSSVSISMNTRGD